MQINLFYLAKPKFGGWVTYTVHLARALQDEGHEVALYRLGARSEAAAKDYGSGFACRRVNEEEARFLVGTSPSIVTAIGPESMLSARALLQDGAVAVIHDPTELKAKPAWDTLKSGRSHVVIVREGNAKHFAGTGVRCTYVPHPYVPHAPAGGPRKKHAVAISRLDWDKHTLTIAKANALVDPDKRVEIYGAENRMYTHLKLDAELPTWREHYRGGYAPTFDAAVELAAGARYMVDLSAIAGDGDGTQYTFLEAWDAGAVLVVNKKWIVEGKGAVRHGETAYAVANERELATLLTEAKVHKAGALQAAGRKELEKHSSSVVVPRMLEALECL